MYVVLVYDVEEQRVSKVCNYLRRYLNWVQNSAFEGEITRAKLEKVKVGLKEIVDLETDSIYIYKVRDAKWLSKEIIGQERALVERII